LVLLPGMAVSCLWVLLKYHFLKEMSPGYATWPHPPSSLVSYQHQWEREYMHSPFCFCCNSVPGKPLLFGSQDLGETVGQCLEQCWPKRGHVSV
jgi:hypothetical protein